MAKKNLLIIKRRLAWTFIIFIFVIVALTIRIFYIQFVQGKMLSEKAFEQQSRTRTISPERGLIFDKNGKELSINISVKTITINPNEFRNTSRKDGLSKEEIEEAADIISIILNKNMDDIYQILTKEGKYEGAYQVLKRKVDESISNEIKKVILDKNYKGITILDDTKRMYPKNNLASHIIGFTGDDNQGLEGIERIYDSYLKGVPGRTLTATDLFGRLLPFEVESKIDANNGLNLFLTIDENIQRILERILDEAVLKYQVEGGATGIIMNPWTGEILAMSSKPDYNLNFPREKPKNYDSSSWSGFSEKDVEVLREMVWKNKAVLDTYEPGSTFKTITAAAGIEENIIKEDSIVDDYPIEIGDWTFNCWSEYLHGVQTFVQGFYNSCNPVFVKISIELGIEKFYSYLKAFGFYDKTRIDYTYESNSIIHKEPTIIDMASASFGQRFTITPIQLITAYNAVINGGDLMKPYILKAMSDSNGNIVNEIEPEIIRNVISKDTSSRMRVLLESVVSKGTGKNAYIRGYRVAGKTGTSETTEEGYYISSFIGFAPANRPVISVLIILDNPKSEAHGGGTIVAPLVGEIIEETLSYLGIEREYTKKDEELINQAVYIPNYLNIGIEDTIKNLLYYKLNYRIIGEDEGNEVVFQRPLAGISVPINSTVILYKEEQEELIEVMPDLNNMTIEEAAKIMKELDLNIKIHGIGSVIEQSVESGTTIPLGTIVDVFFRHSDNIE